DGAGVVVWRNCAKSWTGTDTCGWCGVWLAELDSGHVPPAARPLLGLARRWGIPDDGYRSKAPARRHRPASQTIGSLLRRILGHLWTRRRDARGCSDHRRVARGSARVGRAVRGTAGPVRRRLRRCETAMSFDMFA